MFILLFLVGCFTSQNPLNYDEDGDGYSEFEGDCNDKDASIILTTNDADCDGVSTADDCDDNDPTTINDMDCDGISTSLDCDDNNDTMPNDDADCDGVSTSLDCDDNDPNSSIITNDADCDGLSTSLDCDDNDPANTNLIPNDDADCDGVSTSLDCDDNDTLIRAWDNSTESPIVSAVDKYWFYTYSNPPNFGGDTQYNGLDGAMNDYIESYYGDSLTTSSWETYWAWWQNDDPSVIISLGTIPLQISSVGVYASHGNGGGVSYPAAITISHRANPNSSWTILQTDSLPAVIGWAWVPLITEPLGGEIKLYLVHSAQHTIISELSIQGVCVP